MNPGSLKYTQTYATATLAETRSFAESGRTSSREWRCGSQLLGARRGGVWRQSASERAGWRVTRVAVHDVGDTSSDRDDADEPELVTPVELLISLAAAGLFVFVLAAAARQRLKRIETHVTAMRRKASDAVLDGGEP